MHNDTTLQFYHKIVKPQNALIKYAQLYLENADKHHITPHKLDNPQIQSQRLFRRGLHIEKCGHTTISSDSANAEAGARTRWLDTHLINRDCHLAP